MADTPKSAAEIAELVCDIDIAMLTTIGKGGALVSRPLSTQRSQFDGRRMLFMTEADSPKVGEIRRNPRLNLAYASKGRNTYVSMSGRGSIFRDQATIDALWNDALKAFFPGGKDDPNLTLLQVDVETVEYWDGPGSLIGKAIGFVIARVTKREEAMGENRIVDLRGRATSRLPPSHADARASSSGRAGKAAKKTAKTGTAAKKTTAKKAAATKATAKKKTTAKKTAAKRPAETKAAAKKSTANKSTLKPGTSTKSVAKKSASRRAG